MIKLTKLIGIIERCSLQYRNAEFKEIGLCGAHHKYIFYLCRKPGLSQEQLAKDIYVNKSNVARSIKMLEEGGFVYVKVDEDDKRVNRVYPTDKAYEVLPLIKEKIASWNETLLSGLTEEEVESLGKMLYSVAKNAVEQIEEDKWN